MICRNIYQTEGIQETSHAGKGQVNNILLYDLRDFESALHFIMYTELQPGQSIGYHPHGQNEEVYVVLQGRGQMQVNGEVQPVKRGDVLLNKAGWSHGIENDSGEVLGLLIFEVLLA